MKRSNRKSILMLAASFITGCLLVARIEAHEGLNTIFGGNTSNLPPHAVTGEKLKSMIEQVPCENLNQLSPVAWEMVVTCNDLNFPTIIHTNESGSVIWARYNLAAIPENARPEEYTPCLLEMLAKNGTIGDCFFSYDPQYRMIQVWNCIQVRGEVTVEDLKNQLVMLADLAAGTRTLWDPTQWGQDAPRHTGQWNAAAAGMVLVLDNAGRFELRANNTVTSGNYTIDGDNMTMVDDRGEKISAQVRFDNANQFTLLVNGNEIGFVRQ